MADFTRLDYGDLTLRQRGFYTSFPSLARDPKTQDVLLLYRQARFDPNDKRPGMQAHGLEGNLYLMRYTPGQKKPVWQGPELFCSGEDYPPGLIDGVLSNTGKRLHVMVRGFPRKTPAYYTSGTSINTLGPFRPFPSRYKMRRGAQWGKVVADAANKTLYQVYYGGPWEAYRAYEAGHYPRPMTRPALYHSFDQGKTWHFKSWISPLLMEDSLSGDETTLLIDDGVFYALIRTMGEDPGPLMLTTSIDGGKSWTPPRRSGLFGQAPMFYHVPDGPILLAYRGYQNTTKPENGNFSICMFTPETETFTKPFVVDHYKGNRYDGGYGDLIWLPEEKRLLTVYYYSNTPKTRHPWLRYRFLQLNGTP